MRSMAPTAAAMLALLLAYPLAAQRPTADTAAAREVPATRPAVEAALVGRLLDQTSSKPITGATVRLGGSEHTRITDAAGLFRFAPVPAGAYVVQIRHAMYGVGHAVLRVEAELTEIEFRMAEQAVPLEPLVVTARAPRLEAMMDFYRRAARGRGYFVTQRDIAEKRPVRVSDLLSVAPGMGVTRNPAGTAVVRSADPRNGRDCPILFYVDGSPVTLDDGRFSLPTLALDHFRVDEIAGIEVYRRTSEAPPQFKPIGKNACGVVVVWLK